MIASLYAGISGLSANATAMTVIGDNIANVNTTAFKSNRSHFANILSASLGGDAATASVGRGVEFWGVNAQWTQGSLENSTSATDLAIVNGAYQTPPGKSSALGRAFPSTLFYPQLTRNIFRSSATCAVSAADLARCSACWIAAASFFSSAGV